MSLTISSTMAAGVLTAAGLFMGGLAVSAGVAGADPVDPCAGMTVEGAAMPESMGGCEQERDSCLAMNRQEDVYGNGYIPADAYSDCMQGYWYCRGGQG